MTHSSLNIKIIINYYVKYIIKRKKEIYLNLINDEYDDWRSEITKWFNKHLTDGYSDNSKQLFLYGEHYNEFKAFIKQMMGNLFYLNKKKFNNLLN